MPFSLADHLKWAAGPDAKSILAVQPTIPQPFPAVDDAGSINLLVMADILARGGQVEHQDKVTEMVMAASRFGGWVTNLEHGMASHNKRIQADMVNDMAVISTIASELGAKQVVMPFALSRMAHGAKQKKLITDTVPAGDGPTITFHTAPYSFDFAAVGNINPERPESIFFASLNHRTGIRGYVLYAEGLQYRWERSMDDDCRNPGGQKCLPL